MANRRNSSKRRRQDSTHGAKRSAHRAAKRGRLTRAGAEAIRWLRDFDRELYVTAVVGSVTVLDADEGGEGSDLTRLA